MSIQANDFKFIEKIDEYEDYWFKVNGESKKILTDKYMEMCMIEVSKVVYSKKDDIVGVRREFPFNYNVITSNDNELKNILLLLVNKVDKEFIDKE